jgi:hypothetical protein
MRNVYRTLLGKPEGKSPLGRRRLVWEDVIMDVQEVDGKVGVEFDWLGIETTGRLLWNTVMNLQVP